MSADAPFAPRLVEVVRVRNVGFRVFTEGREGRRSRALFHSAVDANAEAKTLHEIDLAFHELGESRGEVERPRPLLKLWEGDDVD